MRLHQGSVNVPSLNKPVLLVGKEHMNRATSGDSVAVELLPESEWRASAEEVLDQDGQSSPLYASSSKLSKTL